VKPLLYVFRVLLTGIHLMRTGEIEANLLSLNATAKLPIDKLVDRKLAGPEQGRLDVADLDFYEREYQRLTSELETAAEQSDLPDTASGKQRLNDLLVRLRLGTGRNPYSH
jgi:predicted nucleotidyltransferase